MRTFSKVALVWALVLLAITTIISVTDAYTPPCEDCLVAAMYALSPTCKSLTRGLTADDRPFTEEQKLCLCPIISSDTWPLQCVKPELCTDQNANEQLVFFKSFRGDCPNAVAPTTTTDKPSSSATGAPHTSTNAATRLAFSSRVVVGAVGVVYSALL
ncbi:hypothetical protein BGZ89_006508 [Linnemannia elongata]|nr:hypothetical protein BGZ89_006508 [Linnemannia elongata]